MISERRRRNLFDVHEEKKKNLSKARQPATPGERVDTPPKKTRTLPDQPPESEDDDIYVHAPYLKDYTSHGSPPDVLPPTPVELLAFATAIHGPTPLPEKRKALEQLFNQAFVLWQKSQYQIKIFSERLRRLQEEMVPVRTEDDPLCKQFKNVGGFFRYVTGLKRYASREFHAWLDSKKLDPEKHIENFKRMFVDAAGLRAFLEPLKEILSVWHQENVRTSRRNSAARKKCYAFVRKVANFRETEEAKAAFEEWKKHEATTGHQTGEGDALLERLRERFEPWWNKKQADNENANEARKASRSSPQKKN